MKNLRLLIEPLSLIGKQNTSRLDVNHRIHKTTGLYVRFLQTSFRAMLNYPDEGIGDISEATDPFVGQCPNWLCASHQSI